jgi:hypothetical protein
MELLLSCHSRSCPQAFSSFSLCISVPLHLKPPLSSSRSESFPHLTAQRKHNGDRVFIGYLPCILTIRRHITCVVCRRPYRNFFLTVSHPGDAERRILHVRGPSFYTSRWLDLVRKSTGFGKPHQLRSTFCLCKNLLVHLTPLTPDSRCRLLETLALFI